ncbi:MAG: class I SAM-dependent methyltransferase [Promethearchaeota archaeon]
MKKLLKLPEEYNEEYFESKYADFTKKKGGVIPKFYSIKQHISQTINTTGLQILEIGCGYGFLLREFQDGNQLYGIDISEFAIKQTHEYLNAKLNVHDIQESVPFNQNFDLILAIDVLEHLSKLETALTNIKQMMHSKTLLVIEIPLFTGSFYNKLIWKLVFDKDPTHIVKIPYHQLKKIMNSHGFKNIFCGTVLELPGFTKIISGPRWMSLTGAHYGYWRLSAKE